VGELAIGEFVRLHPWLKELNASVKQQVFRDLAKAYRAGLAKNRARRSRGQRVQLFVIKRKQRCDPSSWTFCLPAQHIRAEHVPRPTDGPAQRGQPQPQRKPRTWTKLTLPAALGGVEGRGAARRAGEVFLAQRAPLDSEGKLLGDVRFTRDRLGRARLCSVAVMAEKESCICSQRSSMLASRAVRLEAFISANARAAAAAAGLAAGVGGRVPLPARGAERGAEGRGRRAGGARGQERRGDDTRRPGAIRAWLA
jgi:hypothetical protein